MSYWCFYHSSRLLLRENKANLVQQQAFDVDKLGFANWKDFTITFQGCVLQMRYLWPWYVCMSTFLFMKSKVKVCLIGPSTQTIVTPFRETILLTRYNHDVLIHIHLYLNLLKTSQLSILVSPQYSQFSTLLGKSAAAQIAKMHLDISCPSLLPVRC